MCILLISKYNNDMLVYKKKLRNLPIILFDFLCLVLVIFPITTGGISIDRPGHYFIELSDLGIPVIVVTVYAFILWIFQAENFELNEKSIVSHYSSQIWNQWKKEIENRPYRALLTSSLFVAIIWGTASLKRYFTVQEHSMDLTIFTNTMWNFVHGRGYISSLKNGMSLFTDHQSPTFLLLAPFFYFFPSAVTLLVIQSIYLSATGILTYKLSTQYLEKGHWGRAVIPILYWSYIPIRNACNFDFHPETMLLPAFLLSIISFQSKDVSTRLLGIIPFICALGAKESAGPIAVGLGLAWLLGAGPSISRTFTIKIAPLIILAGFFTFYLDVSVVPKMFGVPYSYGSQYSYLGNNPSQIIVNALENPSIIIGKVFRNSCLRFLFWTLAPLGFLPLFNWRAIIAVFPAYAMLFLGESDGRIHINYHYGIEPAVGLFFLFPVD